MNKPTPLVEDRTGSGVSSGLFLIIVAIAALLLIPSIKNTNLSGAVGPRSFPLALSLILLVGGVGYFLGGAVAWRKDRKTNIDFHASSVWEVILMVLGVLGAIISWPFAGTSVALFLLAAWVMVRLGQRLWIAVVASAVLVVAIRLLFERVFHTPLPSSSLWERWVG